MRVPLLFLSLLLAGCSSLETQINGLEHDYIIFQEKYHDGVAIYKPAFSGTGIESISINMKSINTVDMLIKYDHFSFVYAVGFAYENRVITSETRIVKLEYRITVQSLFHPMEGHFRLSRKQAEELVKYKSVKITLKE